MKLRVGRKKGTVVLDELGSVVCEFTYNKKEGIAQDLAQEYVKLKNSGWQPIETAPLDKTLVLVYTPGRLSIARHDEHRVYIERGTRSLLAPSHWMPLPEPPQ